MENLDRLTEVFHDVFDDEELVLTPETNIRMIEGWDSLTHITLMAAVQDEFDIIYTIDQVTSMHTVADILATL